MKIKIRVLSAVILLISSTVTFFSACKSEDTEITTIQTAESTTRILPTDYTYKPIVITTNINETEYVYTVPPIPTFENGTDKTSGFNNEPSRVAETTTQKISSGGNVEEIVNGLSIITKTSPVRKGNSASIIIQGTPGTKYTIEFYKNSSEKADYSGLDEITADSSGFASWTFGIDNDCEPGDRKIIIKEKNSNKYIQTSITVQ